MKFILEIVLTSKGFKKLYDISSVMWILQYIAKPTRQLTDKPCYVAGAGRVHSASEHRVEDGSHDGK